MLGRWIIEPECKECKVLREWLDSERAEISYLREMLEFKSAPIIPTAIEAKDDFIRIPSRANTLSSVRNQMSHLSRVARDNEKTQSEKAFEGALNEAREEKAIQ